MFFSADLEWMDYPRAAQAVEAGLASRRGRQQVGAHRAGRQRRGRENQAGCRLRPALGENGKIATGDPDSVPVGKYAKAALTKLGVWDKVSGRVVGAENVRAALAFVARGEAPLGIVYKTDALAEKKVRIVAEFPADTHPPITYPIALTANASADAARFAEFVRGSEAAAVFRKFGFEPLR